MLTTGSRIFFHFPSEASERTLHAGSITEQQDGGFLAVMDETNLAVKPGADAFVHYEHQRVFMQQPVHIDAVLTQSDLDVPIGRPAELDDDPFGFTVDGRQVDAHVETLSDTDERILIGFQTTGEPVSAESRQCYRVLTSISSNVNAVINTSLCCPVLDISATGFAVLADTPLRIGQVVRITLQHEQNEYAGTAVVQSEKPLDDGRVRHGLYCAGDERTNGSLIKGLQQIATIIQRQQLRRMNGMI